MTTSINNFKGGFEFSKLNNGIGNMWAKGREIKAHECKSGDCVEIVYAPNELEASKLFKAQYSNAMVVAYVRPIAADNIENIVYSRIIN
jgi:hypothetical protein